MAQLGAGTRMSRAPAIVTAAGGAMRTMRFREAVTRRTEVCSAGGVSAAACAVRCSTARNRGCSSTTEAGGTIFSATVGAPRPTGFIVSPVVSGITSGGAERALRSDATPSGAIPSGGRLNAARFWLKAFCPARTAALAVSILSEEAFAT